MEKSTYNYTEHAKVGRYFYCMHRGFFAVYMWDYVSNRSTSATFVEDYLTREDARNKVFELNGWTRKSA